MTSRTESGTWAEIYDIVRLIPHGKVMNYGQIARLLSRPLSARTVGWAMSSCPEDVPWQRVVNAAGGCSTATLPGHPPDRQQKMLETEGIEFGADGTLDMERHRWQPEQEL